jgi:hypothetical protein
MTPEEFVRSVVISDGCPMGAKWFLDRLEAGAGIQSIYDDAPGFYLVWFIDEVSGRWYKQEFAVALDIHATGGRFYSLVAEEFFGHGTREYAMVFMDLEPYGEHWDAVNKKIADMLRGAYPTIESLLDALGVEYTEGE